VPDQAEAVRWRTLAADAGDIDSLLALADRRRGVPSPNSIVSAGAPGRSEPTDPVAALALYQRAALAGSIRAMLALATMHIDGFGGVPRDSALAEQWARRAYDAGDFHAGLQLALWMRDGRLGRKVDGAEVVSILQKVAEGPDENARARAAAANLATMYANGLGVRVDRAEEARWQARVDALLADNLAVKKAAERAVNEARSAWLRERAKFWEE
jgi:TPR repeat protein